MSTSIEKKRRPRNQKRFCPTCGKTEYRIIKRGWLCQNVRCSRADFVMDSERGTITKEEARARQVKIELDQSWDDLKESYEMAQHARRDPEDAASEGISLASALREVGHNAQDILDLMGLLPVPLPPVMQLSPVEDNDEG